jgi:hypothetical protein
VKRHSRLLLVIHMVVLAAVVTLGATPVLAVHNKAFELDGNIVNTPGGAQTVDWADLFNVSGTNVPTPKPSLPAGFSAAKFSRDFQINSNSDSSVYATGSKDTLNILGGWQCKIANNVNDKTDLLNAYIVAYNDTSVTPAHTLVYFGIETASNEGTRDVGIWLLKDQTVGCVAGTGNTNFVGNHTDGDILIVAEYTGSSGVSFIQAFRWNGGPEGSLGTSPSVVGTDCRTAAANDAICARTNSEVLFGATPTPTTLGVPWLTKTKTSNPSQPGLGSDDLDIGEFFEGGIDLTASGLSGCFATTLFNTRSSASPGATIFDFTLTSFPLCTLTVDKFCDTDVPENPHVTQGDPDTLNTTFQVVITGTGQISGPVTLKEDHIFVAGEKCEITAISGGTGSPTVFPIAFGSLGSNPLVTVSTSLTGPINVTVVCESVTNPLINAVTAAAGGLTDSHVMSATQACALGNPHLTVAKVCADPADIGRPAVTLDPNGGFSVCVQIRIQNNSGEDLTNFTVVDTPALIAGSVTTVPSDLLSGGTLQDSAMGLVNGCYHANNPDGNETNPCLAMFTDQVQSVVATGVTSGLPVIVDTSPLPSASCPLCPCP